MLGGGFSRKKNAIFEADSSKKTALVLQAEGQGVRGCFGADPQGVVVQQLPVQRPCHEHLSVGVVGGPDLKSPADVPRCQRESHLETSQGKKTRAGRDMLRSKEGKETPQK